MSLAREKTGAASSAAEAATPFATMMSLFDEAAALVSIDPAVYRVLRKPDREIEVAVPVTLDDGTLAVFDGWRVQHNQGLGPYCGPLLLDADLSVDDLRARAAWMTWKCALLGVPFGGAAGGVAIDRERRSEGELQRAVRRYTANLLDVIGPDRDIFMAERARDEHVMGWVMDTVSMHLRHTVNAVVTGKPLDLGGTRHHQDAAAQGLRIVLELAAQRFGFASASPGPSVIVQGAGFVGGALARLLHEGGWRVIGVSDASGGFHDPRGLDVPALLAQRDPSGSLARARGKFERLTDDDLLALPCDAVVSCAVEDAISGRMVERLATSLVVEGQHGALSAPVHRAIDARGIHVVPDILARGGDTLAGYFEWVQNRTGFAWQEDEILRRMRRFLEEAWADVIELHQGRGISLRTAANAVAVQHVARATKLRGLYA